MSSCYFFQHSFRADLQMLTSESFTKTLACTCMAKLFFWQIQIITIDISILLCIFTSCSAFSLHFPNHCRDSLGFSSLTAFMLHGMYCLLCIQCIEHAVLRTLNTCYMRTQNTLLKPEILRFPTYNLQF